MKITGKIVVWPANLDSTKSRTEGRKISKGLAIQTPKLEEMNEAAKRLSIEAEFVPGKSRPNLWWERSGYAILAKKGSRTSFTHELASEIKKIRAARAEQDSHKR